MNRAPLLSPTLRLSLQGDARGAAVQRLVVHVFRQVPGAPLLRAPVLPQGQRGALRTLHPQGLPPVLLVQPDGGFLQVGPLGSTRLTRRIPGIKRLKGGVTELKPPTLQGKNEVAEWIKASIIGRVRRIVLDVLSS